MVYEDREYQIAAETALLKSLYYGHKNTHPVIAVPTGGGKTKIMGSFIYKYLEWRPTHNVLVVSHTESILKQDHKALSSFFPGINIGLYSSGLGRKTVEKITVAGIQSAYRVPLLFDEVDLIIVDECHTVPPKGNGMYRQFFKALPKAQRIGMSATVFRTGSGYVHVGKNALFNQLVYNLCTLDKFNKLVDDGYLAPLYSKPPQEELNVEGARTSAGDFNTKDLSILNNRIEITKRAVAELVKFGKNYKSWLIFAINIEHADNICEELFTHNIEADVLHSKSTTPRSVLENRFKDGEIKALVSVGMVTTGFDAPNIDLIALLRPTKSPVLHVQMIGRGLRTCEKTGKTHCLVLDFAGNVKRLGPINDVQVPIKGKKKSNGGDPIVKQCPRCGCLHHPTVKICTACGHVFVFKEKLNSTIGNDEVVIKDKKKWVEVTGVKYFLHTKKGRPTSLRVKYSCGLFTVSEYVCYDHEGYAKHKANNWVKNRWSLHKMPPNVSTLFSHCSHLRVPKQLHINLGLRYPEIIGAKFE